MKFQIVRDGQRRRGKGERGERREESKENREKRAESREKIAEKRQQRGERVKTEVASQGESSFCLSANCVKSQRSFCFL